MVTAGSTVRCNQENAVAGKETAVNTTPMRSPTPPPIPTVFNPSQITCMRMSLGVAPTARRMPSSRIRRYTDSASNIPRSTAARSSKPSADTMSALLRMRANATLSE